ncbi:hypothetical protein GALMADRAFT_1160882 [Galerina marginata CBS 339.88]|uniref:DUF6534 domain-containing protein n=1 Tax=Galerina marginata (strain CBS 339.88) TaxID=685588 RepID=A0A067SEQ9_GALM3|nr:hypothetical protein GALMADRAFT_1160882 [Galerina marginata CBS 339.88]
MILYANPVAADTGIQRIYGPMLIGVFCSSILYGVLVVQVYNYWLTYKKDLRIIRYLILYLFLVETIHTAIAMYMMYQPLIINFGSGLVFRDFPTALPAEPILTILISTPIQVFIAWRIWRIQNSFWIPAFVCVLAAVSAAGGIWTGIVVVVIGVFAGTPQAYPAVYLWLVSAATADIMITGSLAVILLRRKTGLPSDAVISRIVLFTIQTGLLTSISAVVDVVLLLVVPHTTVNFLVDVTLAKIYAISLISTLNARESLNKGWDHHHSFLLDTGDVRRVMVMAPFSLTRFCSDFRNKNPALITRVEPLIFNAQESILIANPMPEPESGRV